MVQKVNVDNVSAEDLIRLISEAFEERIKNLDLKTKIPSEYLTREETCKLLRISKPTLHELTYKRGLLKGYRIGGRVLYMRSEVECSLEEIQTTKYKRVHR